MPRNQHFLTYLAKWRSPDFRISKKGLVRLLQQNIRLQEENKALRQQVTEVSHG